MGKKRVHELAKEFGLDNREVVQRLQAAGMQVKTHSSSVYEDEARAILTRGAVPEEPIKAARPGMTIVRKKKPTDGEEAVGEPAWGTPAEPASELSAESPAEPEAEPEPEAPADDEPAMAASPEDESEEPAMEEPEAEETSAPEPVAEKPEPFATAPAKPEPTPAAPPAAGPDDSKSKPKPKGTVSATVVRMIDREKLLERVPGRRLGGGGAATGPKYGQVTELKVVTDPFGRGREIIDVGRDKKGRVVPGKVGPAGKKTRAPTKREMMEMRERSLHPSRLKKKKTIKRVARKTEVTQPKASKRVIKMKETIPISDLAHQLGLKAVEVVQKLVGLGVMVNINQSIDFDTAQLVAQEYGYTVDSTAFAENEIIAKDEIEEAAEDLEPRPPVVTVMGHVDHGKTSLLDAIRKTRVAAGEAGGITQHIGAYQVKVPKKGTITFLDTPGHAAFSEMRARGAEATDIVVLVVAAEDGVMPQTEEAIRHAQAAKVPIIVAINKIDRPDANPERVMQELSKFELIPEAWGGQTLMVPTSATKGTGVPELLETILLQAEILELKANPKRAAMGLVIEAQLDKGRGPVVTVLVKHGTLRRGDPIVVGEACGKIRAMMDDQGRDQKEAGPSSAVEITGLDAVPEAGEVLNAVESAEAAREVAEHRRAQKRSQEMTTDAKMSLDDLMARMKTQDSLELKVVLKADVRGSAEAIKEALLKLSTSEVKVSVIYDGVGAITESDVNLASSTNGIILGFGVRPDSSVRAAAEREKVEIRTYRIIYEMIDDVRKAMEGLLSPVSKEKVVGHAEVRDIFKITKVGTIAGCRVTDGKAVRSARVRVLRDSIQVFEGKVASLKHFKDDAREVDSGLECGVSVDGFNDLKVNDVFEFYQLEEVARTLDTPPSGKRPPGNVEAHP